MRTIDAGGSLMQDGLPKRKIGHQRGSHSLLQANEGSLMAMKRHSHGGMVGMQSTRAVAGAGRIAGAELDSSIAHASPRPMLANPGLSFGGSRRHSPAALSGGLGGGPMRGIHPHPFSHPFKGAPALIVRDDLVERNAELSKMVLPKIEKRKLSDLMSQGAKNPFKVEPTSEKLMVMREKQREIEKLDSIRKKIEHKYLHGLPLMHSLAMKKQGDGMERQFSLDRHGMLKEVDSIKALKIPSQVYHSFNSAASRAGFPRHKSLAMDANRLV